jgi:hypothetical protein
MLWAGLGIGLAGGVLSYSGFVMASSFTVSNPERIEHWRRVAHIFLALTGICAVVVVGLAVALYRRRETGASRPS